VADSKRPPGRFREIWREVRLALVIFLVSAFFLVLLPWSLIVLTAAIVDAYQLSRGLDGVEGTAVVETVNYTEYGVVCDGTFTPDDGGATIAVRIEFPGDCELDRQMEARLPDEDSTHLGITDEGRAWVHGSNDWGVWIIALIPYGVVAVPITVAAGMFTFASAANLASIPKWALKRLREEE